MIQKEEEGIKRDVKCSDFLPLMDDWFIRPLFYLDKMSSDGKESFVILAS